MKIYARDWKIEATTTDEHGRETMTWESFFANYRLTIEEFTDVDGGKVYTWRVEFLTEDEWYWINEERPDPWFDKAEAEYSCILQPYADSIQGVTALSRDHAKSCAMESARWLTAQSLLLTGEDLVRYST